VKFSELKFTVKQWNSFTYYRSSVILLWFPNIDLRFYSKCKISWNSVPWERSCSMRTDRETGRRNKMKLIVTFRNFAILPKNGHRSCHSSRVYSPICHRECSGSIISHRTWVLDETSLAMAQVICFSPVSITPFLIHAHLFVTDAM